MASRGQPPSDPARTAGTVVGRSATFSSKQQAERPTVSKPSALPRRSPAPTVTGHQSDKENSKPPIKQFDNMRDMIKAANVQMKRVEQLFRTQLPTQVEVYEFSADLSHRLSGMENQKDYFERQREEFAVTIDQQKDNIKQLKQRQKELEEIHERINDKLKDNAKKDRAAYMEYSEKDEVDMLQIRQKMSGDGTEPSPDVLWAQVTEKDKNQALGIIRGVVDDFDRTNEIRNNAKRDISEWIVQRTNGEEFARNPEPPTEMTHPTYPHELNRAREGRSKVVSSFDEIRKFVDNGITEMAEMNEQMDNINDVFTMTTQELKMLQAAYEVALKKISLMTKREIAHRMLLYKQQIDNKQLKKDKESQKFEFLKKEREMEHKIEDVQQDYDNLQRESEEKVEDLEKNLRSEKHKLKKALKENGELKQRVEENEDIELMMENMRETMKEEAQKIEDLEAQVDNFRGKWRDSEEQIAKMGHDRRDLENKLADIEKNERKAREELMAKTAEERAAREQELANSAKMLEQAKMEINEKMNEMKAMDDLRLMAEDEKARMEHQLSVQDHELKELSEKFEREMVALAQEKDDHWQYELDSLKKDLEDQISDLQVDLKEKEIDFEDELNEMKKEKEKLEEELKEAQVNVDDLKTLLAKRKKRGEEDEPSMFGGSSLSSFSGSGLGSKLPEPTPLTKKDKQRTRMSLDDGSEKKSSKEKSRRNKSMVDQDGDSGLALAMAMASGGEDSGKESKATRKERRESRRERKKESQEDGSAEDSKKAKLQKAKSKKEVRMEESEGEPDQLPKGRSKSSRRGSSNEPKDDEENEKKSSRSRASSGKKKSSRKQEVSEDEVSEESAPSEESEVENQSPEEAEARRAAKEERKAEKERARKERRDQREKRRAERKARKEAERKDHEDEDEDSEEESEVESDTESEDTRPKKTKSGSKKRHPKPSKSKSKSSRKQQESETESSLSGSETESDEESETESESEGEGPPLSAEDILKAKRMEYVKNMKKNRVSSMADSDAPMTEDPTTNDADDAEGEVDEEEAMKLYEDAIVAEQLEGVEKPAEGEDVVPKSAFVKVTKELIAETEKVEVRNLQIKNQAQEIRKLERHAKDLRAQMQHLHAQAEEKIRLCQSEINREILERKKVEAEMKEAGKASREEIKQLTRQLEKSKRDTEKVKNDLNREQQKRKEKEEWYANRIKHFEEQLLQLKEQNKELKRQAEQFNKKNLDLVSKLKSEQMENMTRADALSSLEVNLSKALSDFHSVESTIEITQLRAKDDLRDKVHEYDTRVKRILEEKQALLDKLAHVAQENESLHRKVVIVEDKPISHTFAQRRNASEKENLLAEIAAKEAQLAEIEETLLQQRTENELIQKAAALKEQDLERQILVMEGRREKLRMNNEYLGEAEDSVGGILRRLDELDTMQAQLDGIGQGELYHTILRSIREECARHDVALQNAQKSWDDERIMLSKKIITERYLAANSVASTYKTMLERQRAHYEKVADSAVVRKLRDDFEYELKNAQKHAEHSIRAYRKESHSMAQNLEEVKAKLKTTEEKLVLEMHKPKVCTRPAEHSELKKLKHRLERMVGLNSELQKHLALSMFILEERPNDISKDEVDAMDNIADRLVERDQELKKINTQINYRAIRARIRMRQLERRQKQYELNDQVQEAVRRIYSRWESALDKFHKKKDVILEQRKRNFISAISSLAAVPTHSSSGIDMDGDTSHESNVLRPMTVMRDKNGDLCPQGMKIERPPQSVVDIREKRNYPDGPKETKARVNESELARFVMQAKGLLELDMTQPLDDSTSFAKALSEASSIGRQVGRQVKVRSHNPLRKALMQPMGVTSNPWGPDDLAPPLARNHKKKTLSPIKGKASRPGEELSSWENESPPKTADIVEVVRNLPEVKTGDSIAGYKVPGLIPGRQPNWLSSQKSIVRSTTPTAVAPTPSNRRAPSTPVNQQSHQPPRQKSPSLDVNTTKLL